MSGQHGARQQQQQSQHSPYLSPRGHSSSLGLNSQINSQNSQMGSQLAPGLIPNRSRTSSRSSQNAQMLHLHLNQQQMQSHNQHGMMTDFEYENESMHTNNNTNRSSHTSSTSSVSDRGDYSDFGIFGGNLQSNSRGYDMGDVLSGLEDEDFLGADRGTASRRGSCTMSEEMMGGGSASKRNSYTMSDDSGVTASRRPSYTMHASQIVEVQSHLENDFAGFESHLLGLGGGLSGGLQHYVNMNNSGSGSNLNSGRSDLMSGRSDQMSFHSNPGSEG